MPIYRYRCNSCSKHFDRILTVNEGEQEVKCEDCKKPAQKMISSFSNYTISGNNTASTRPNFSKRRK